MPRGKSFTPADAVRTARDRFWEHGYEATSLADLERVTGLNRSSLYQAFGTKRQLFELALRSYLEEVAWPRIATVETPGAGPAAVRDYFTALAAAISRSPAGGYGCLVVNSITELGAHDGDVRATGTAYRRRVTDAFAGAFAAAMPAADASRRAEIATGVLTGVLVTARLSRSAAARMARAAADDLG